MRSVGDEPALGLERRLEPAEQAVERVGQLLELVVGPLERQALVQVALGDAARARLIVRTGRSARPAISQPSPIEASAMIASATPERVSSGRELRVLTLAMRALALAWTVFELRRLSRGQPLERRADLAGVGLELTASATGALWRAAPVPALLRARDPGEVAEPSAEFRADATKAGPSPTLCCGHAARR